MEALFMTLTQAVAETPQIALAASLAWGVLSVVLSPCHMASIPLIVGFIDGRGQMTTRRAFVISILFAVGILITIGVIGVVTSAAGRMLGDLGAWSTWLVAVVFVAVGLHLLDLLPLPLPGTGSVDMARKGTLAAFLLGLIFGLALGPCTFAFMAPVLAVVFSQAADSIFFGASLVVAYGLGHCAVIVLAGTFAHIIQRYLDWNERSRGAVVLKKFCGILVLSAAAWMIYSSP